MPHRTLAAFWLLLLLAFPIYGAFAPKATAGGSGAPCGDVRALPAEVGPARTAATTLCLLNRERAARGLKPLRRVPALRQASAAHARDMVARRFVGHDSSTGLSFSERILRTPYVDVPAADVTIGENLGWGSGRRASPAHIVRAWMRSPEHRANILQPAFRHVGLAVVEGTPSQAAPLGATFTAIFGTRTAP